MGLTCEHVCGVMVLTINCCRRAQPTMGGAIPRQVSSEESWLNKSLWGWQQSTFLHGFRVKHLLESLP